MPEYPLHIEVQPHQWRLLWLWTSPQGAKYRAAMTVIPKKAGGRK